MLTDYLQIEEGDQLKHAQLVKLKNRGQEEVNQWIIVGKDGQQKGTVDLFDKLNCRRSYSASYRITQRDQHGQVVVDRLMDVL